MNNNKNSLLIKEACVDSVDQARKAEMLGANRLEICKDLHLDGLTPKIDVVNKIIKEVSIPIKVMIRPRSGNFVYNEFETLKMEQEINQFKCLIFIFNYHNIYNIYVCFNLFIFIFLFIY